MREMLKELGFSKKAIDQLLMDGFTPLFFPEENDEFDELIPETELITKDMVIEDYDIGLTNNIILDGTEGYTDFNLKIPPTL